jgi:hypothetical protein
LCPPPPHLTLKGRLIVDNINLILGDHRGIFIPRDFAQGVLTFTSDDPFDFDGELIPEVSGITVDDLLPLLDPESESYWDTWEHVMNRARYTHRDGRVFTLYQDGDLYLIAYDAMSDGEYEEFFGEPRD